MSDVNRTLTSLLLSHTICRHFWRIVVIEVSYILEWIFVFLEAQLVAHLIVELLFLNVFADLGFMPYFSSYCNRFIEWHFYDGLLYKFWLNGIQKGCSIP